MTNKAEKENTFRILADEPQISTNFWCRFGIHKWQKYQKPVSKRMGVWEYYVQGRYCDCCGKYNERVISKA